MSFGAQELLWICLAAPAAALAGGWLWRRRMRAAARWASRGLWPRLLGDHSGRRAALSVALVSLAILGSALALARPRWGRVEEQVDRQGVDVVFVLDSSLSMAAPDVRPTRFDAAKILIRRLVAGLPGHRVALVQAEGEGVVLAPLTLDAAVVDLLLDGAAAATLARPGTRLAPAFEEAAKLFPPGSQKHRVVVLVSDAEDHGGGLERTIELLDEEGIVVHALGVGTPEGAPLPLPGERDDGYKVDRQGNVVVSRLEEERLLELTAATDGVYVRAADPGAALEPILEAIDSMDRRSLEGEVLTSLAERFQWPLALAVLALAVQLGAGPFRWRAS